MTEFRMDNLPELRDIHLPSGVAAWPPAYGWWVLLTALLALVGLYYLVMYLRRKSKKLYALRLLKNIYCNNSVDAVTQMSEILKRICVFKYPEAAVLFGRDWLDFLNQHSKSKLTGKPAQLLIDGPYLPPKIKGYTPADVLALRQFCTAWIGENL